MLPSQRLQELFTIITITVERSTPGTRIVFRDSVGFAALVLIFLPTHQDP
jgi:hypothetical protein